MHTATAAFVVCLFIAISPQRALSFNEEFDAVTTTETTTTESMTTTTEMPELSTEDSEANSTIYYISRDDEQSRRRQQEGERSQLQNESIIADNSIINKANSTAAVIVDSPKAEARIKLKNQKRRKNSAISEAIKLASIQGFNAMIDLYDRKEPEILRKGQSCPRMNGIMSA